MGVTVFGTMVFGYLAFVCSDDSSGDFATGTRAERLNRLSIDGCIFNIDDAHRNEFKLGCSLDTISCMLIWRATSSDMALRVVQLVEYKKEAPDNVSASVQMICGQRFQYSRVSKFRYSFTK